MCASDYTHKYHRKPSHRINLRQSSPSPHITNNTKFPTISCKSKILWSTSIVVSDFIATASNFYKIIYNDISYIWHFTKNHLVWHINNSLLTNEQKYQLMKFNMARTNNFWDRVLSLMLLALDFSINELKAFKIF